jgi:hypothetical protein
MHETCLPHGPSGTQYQPPLACAAALGCRVSQFLLLRPVAEQNTVHRRAWRRSMAISQSRVLDRLEFDASPRLLVFLERGEPVGMYDE